MLNINNFNMNRNIEQLYKNILKESNSMVSSGDISGFAPLIVPLLKKLYTESFVNQVADVQPLTGSIGKVACLFNLYSGSGSSAQTGTHPNTSFLLVLDNTTSPIWNIDGAAINFGSSTFVARYKEEDVQTVWNNTTSQFDSTPIVKVLLSRQTGQDVPLAGDTFNGVTVLFSTYNRASIKKIFKGYSGVKISDGNGGIQYIGYEHGYDDNDLVKTIGFETRTIDTATVARKLKSKFSPEQFQDMLAVYKEKADDTIAEAISHEINQEIDKEFIQYVKYISQLLTVQNSPLKLEDSYGAAPSGSLQDVSYDLVSNIYLAAEQIVRDTKRNRTIFVLADPVTTAFLQTNAFHVKASPNEKNPYRVGSIGTYPLFCDLYSEIGEFYIIVGYLGIDGNGDSGIIYSPYSTTTHTAIDPNNLTTNLLYLNRYAFTRHPQDTGNMDWTSPWGIDNMGNSDFFKMFTISYKNVKNFGDISVPKFK